MFQIKNIIQKKILRLKGSKNILKLNFFFHKYFGEKDIGEIGLNFLNKPDKKKIVQNTISRKKYKSYLEIGCSNNDLFNHINCEKKVGVDPSVMSLWVNNKRQPNGLHLTKLVKAINCKAEDIYD